MIKRLTKITKSQYTFHQHILQPRISVGPFSSSRFQNFLSFLRRFLNRMSFEDKRSFENLEADKQVTIKNVAKNEVEAENLFKQSQQQLSKIEENRLKRIDDILGTRTYFHETKLYQQRLDSDHLMQISELKKKHRQTSRYNLDLANPQIEPKLKKIGKKKRLQMLSKLSKYPQINPGIKSFTDEEDTELIDFLGKEALYTRLSLNQMDFTFQSLDQQNIYIEDRPKIVGQYAYFKPESLMAIFRIKKQYYKPELITSIKELADNANYCQEVLNIDQVYDCLKEYDYDERVYEYLGKIENNKLQYLVNEMFLSANDSQACFVIDLLGTQKEYCLLYRNLARNQQSKLNKNDVIFNIKPIVAVVEHGVYFIQRNQQGLFIELVKHNFVEDTSEIIYKCLPFNELSIGKRNEGWEQILVEERQLHEKVNNKIYLMKKNELLLLNVHQNTERLTKQISPQQALKHEKYNFQCLQVKSKGFLIFRHHICQPHEYMKFSSAQSIIKFVSFLPFQTSSLIHISDSLTEETATKVEKIDDEVKLDFSGQEIIYKCSQQQFISEVKVCNIEPQSYLLFNLSVEAVYNKNKILIYPFKKGITPYSLYLDGFATKIKNDISIDEKSTIFYVKTPFLQTQFSYQFWKKELTEKNEEQRIYSETITIPAPDRDLKIRVLCSKVFMEQKLPVILYVPSRKEEIDEMALRKLLEKGVMMVQVLNCRGSFSEDAQTLLQGCQKNYTNYIQDLKRALLFIGQNLSDNISLYAKGGSSSLISFLLNIQFPTLFTSTVLHDGVFDLDSDSMNMQRFRQFFGEGEETLKEWKKINPLSLPFDLDEETDVKTIGFLHNIMVSSEKEHREEGRKLLYKLRLNRKRQYSTIYLKEHNKEEEVDIQNLTFLYYNIRTKAQ